MATPNKKEQFGKMLLFNLFVVTFFCAMVDGILVACSYLSHIIGLIVGSIPMNHHKDQIPLNHILSIG